MCKNGPEARQRLSLKKKTWSSQVTHPWIQRPSRNNDTSLESKKNLQNHKMPEFKSRNPPSKPRTEGSPLLQQRPKQRCSQTKPKGTIETPEVLIFKTDSPLFKIRELALTFEGQKPYKVQGAVPRQSFAVSVGF